MGWPHLCLLMCFGLGASTAIFSYPTPVDFSGELLRWDRTPEDPILYYEVEADDSEDFNRFYGYVLMAADLWSDVSGSFLRLEPVPDGQTAQISVKLTRDFSGSEQSSGFATFDEYDESGPKHCRIEISIHDNLSTYSFAKTALHEFGHCVGLGHTLMPKSIMSYYLGENEFRLDTDDAAAVSRLYPISGSSPRLPPGCTIGAAKGENSLVVLLLVGLGPLVVIAMRRKIDRIRTRA